MTPLDEVFEPLVGSDRWVVGQLGQSLDGRIATESGHSHYVTGPEDRRRLHRLRALAQAVVIGAGTAESDDPRLTVRDVEGENPVRVVLDPRGRLDPGLAVFSDEVAPTLWVRAREVDGPTRIESDAHDERAAAADRHAYGAGHPAAAARVESVALDVGLDGWFRPASILDMLASRGLERVLVEGGGVTVSSFLSARVLDRLHVTVAPMLIGSGRPAITLPVIETLDQALRPRVRHVPLGDDHLFDLAFDRARA